MSLQLLKNKAREGSGHGDYCDPCQMLGFISGRVTVTLTGNSDSWDVPQENKAAIFENLFNTNKRLLPSVGIGALCPAGWQPAPHLRM
jgi:hypothetical protein